MQNLTRIRSSGNNHICTFCQKNNILCGASYLMIFRHVANLGLTKSHLPVSIWSPGKSHCDCHASQITDMQLFLLSLHALLFHKGHLANTYDVLFMFYFYLILQQDSIMLHMLRISPHIKAKATSSCVKKGKS